LEELQSTVDSSISNIDSSISTLRYKTSDIDKAFNTEDDESIILATDDNFEVTKIYAEKTIDESEVLEFANESSDEIYAKIGVVDDKNGVNTITWKNFPYAKIVLNNGYVEIYEASSYPNYVLTAKFDTNGNPVE
jgi:hypothetical protein